MKYLLLILFCLLNPNVMASEQTITFVAALSKPHGFYNSNNEPDGLVVKIAELISSTSNNDFDLYLAPPLRVYRELAKGTAELSILPAGENADKVAERIAMTAQSMVVVVGLNERSLVVNSLDDLKESRLGYVKGISYGAIFDNADLTKVPVLGTEVGIEMLMKRRIDYLISSETTIAFHLINKRISDRVKLVHEVGYAAAYLYVSKKSDRKEALKSSFKLALSELHKQNKISALYRPLKLARLP